MLENHSEIIMYQTEDGLTKIEVQMQGETVWLSQAQMAELFQRDISVISRHIRNVFKENEVDEKSNLQNMQIPNSDKPVAFYSLDVIISVGYRVKSLRGTQFRIWANSVLKEYITKGFSMNDDLLKQAGGGNYFDELLGRIRDIRSSEKVFYRKVLDIYATSIDYNPRAEASQRFFKTIQNKMHFAAHGNTAAELIYNRVDGDKPFVGLTSWSGKQPKASDVTIAKNYLTRNELDTLNRIVTIYLEFAELQAKEQTPMYMKDWLGRLNGFLQLSGRELLNHAGKISHEVAEKKALGEYEKYKERTAGELSAVERHFWESIEQTGNKLEMRNLNNGNK